jgi:pimeloyl-ACP methyl ester carboxylesterase
MPLLAVRRTALPALCLVLLAAGALAAPAAGAPVTAGAITGTNGAPVPALDWGVCPAATPEEAEALREVECATAEVPLSYRDPHGQSVEVAVGRLPALDPERRIGSLFWNPGGPGGSGRIPPVFTQGLRERFDLVGFDPRGVGASTPITCFGTTEEAIDLLGRPFPITLAQEREVIAATREGTERCAERGGALLEHVSTANVARDLDLLRRAVGDEQLTYVGYSYGTHLGEVYANLFPDHVRALTLDAVIDPREWVGTSDLDDPSQPLTTRMDNFEGAYDALESFLAECARDARCSFREGGADLEVKYDRLAQRLRRAPVQLVDPDSGERFTVTYQDVVNLTLGLLYAAPLAPVLADALQDVWAATEARGQGLRPRRARQAEVLREPPRRPGFQDEEPYAGLEWFPAVVCSETPNPRNPWVWPRFARAADRQAPYFGSAWLYSVLPCATWPASDEDRYAGPWDRETAPLLLIGNRGGDPATPYDDAQATARLLADARLLTLDSYGHGAFLGRSACIDRAVERYLVDLVLPAEGTVCEPNARPFDPVTEPGLAVPGLPGARVPGLR